MGAGPARQRAARRLEAFVAAECGRRLGAFKRLADAVSSGAIRGLARGVAWRLIEAGGTLDRRALGDDLTSLSKVERRTLRALGVRIGAFCVDIPSLRTPDAASLVQAFAGASPSTVRAMGLVGKLEVAGVPIPARDLERLDDLLRRAPRRGGGAILTDPALSSLGWSAGPQPPQVLRGLGLKPSRGANAHDPWAWRRPAIKPRDTAVISPPLSPFAALAALKSPPKRRSRRRRPKVTHG